MQLVGVCNGNGQPLTLKNGAGGWGGDAGEGGFIQLSDDFLFDRLTVEWSLCFSFLLIFPFFISFLECFRKEVHFARAASLQRTGPSRMPCLTMCPRHGNSKREVGPPVGRVGGGGGRS